MYIKFYLILTILCTSACLQTSQVAQKKIAKRRQATPLELRMIKDAKYGRLTEKELQQYLNKGADINAKNNFGETALILASAYGCTAVVQQLIAADANINAKTNFGYTALMIASLRYHINVVQQLIATGADHTIVNEKMANKTARDGAKDTAIYDKAFAAGLIERKKRKEEYRAQQPLAKKIVEEQWQLIPGISDIITSYAYGQSPMDLPPTKLQEEEKKASSEEEKKISAQENRRENKSRCMFCIYGCSSVSES